MAIDRQQFLAALATWLAAQTSIEAGSKPRGLWVNRAIEVDSKPAAFSSIETFGGAAAWSLPERVAVLCRTIGSSQAAGWAQAQKLYGAMLDGDGRPKRMIKLEGFRVNAIDVIAAPATIGFDEKNRPEIVFNVTMRVVAI